MKSSYYAKLFFECVVLALAAPGAHAGLRFTNAGINSTEGYGTYSVAIGDVNGDKSPDLIVASRCATVGCETTNGAVSVLLSNGDGSFQPPVVYITNGFGWAAMVTIADVNGDNHPDLVVANGCVDSTCDNGAVSVLFNNGNGTFQPSVTYNSGGSAANSIAVADINNDGRPDLVVGATCQTRGHCDNGTVNVMLGNGNGTFQAPVSYNSGGNNGQASQHTVLVQDLNGDGKLDVVVVNPCVSSGDCTTGNVSVLLGNGNGTLQAAVSYNSGGRDAWSVAVADVNGDGHPDLVVSNACLADSCFDGAVAVLLGNGNGTFKSPVTYSSGGYNAFTVAVADVNGDGHADLVVSDFCISITKCGVGGVSVLQGVGDGTFQAATLFKLGTVNTTSVAIGDLNRDGRPDVAVTTYHASTTNPFSGAGVLLNSTPKATTATTITSSLNPAQVSQSVTFTATIASGTSIPDGSAVRFSIGTTVLGTGSTTNGIATLTTSFSKAKSYTVKAKYTGDAFHRASSRTVIEVVNP